VGAQGDGFCRHRAESDRWHGDNAGTYEPRVLAEDKFNGLELVRDVEITGPTLDARRKERPNGPLERTRCVHHKVEGPGRGGECSGIGDDLEAQSGGQGDLAERSP
jgi:hypothetical protein